MNKSYYYDPTGGLATLFSENLKKQRIEMDKTFVSESIGDQFKTWKAEDPVFIDAPTGTRKTTFVYEKIIPEAINQGKCVLLISNRIAISAQQKRKILNIVSKLAPESIAHITEKPDKEIVDSLAFFGPVCVTTYQGIHGLLHSYESNETNICEWFRRLWCIVLDEIHFLYSDSLFNSCCGYLLEKLPWVFRNAIRIYMTATSWEIKELIYESEKAVLSINENLITDREAYISYLIPNLRNEAESDRVKAHRTFYDYCMQADYSAYHLHFFNDALYCPPKSGKNPAQKHIRKKYLLALIDQMNPAPNAKDKWLVFVDKKSSGQKMQAALREKGISVAYIDSAIKKPKSAWKKLIEEEKLETDVLCATPVIECGVNVADDSVHHVAILCTDRTTFIQLLGRKRRKQNESVDLWVWLPDQEYFQNMKKKMEWYIWLSKSLQEARRKYTKQKAQYAQCAKTLWKNKDSLEYESLFYVDNAGLFTVNEYVQYVLGRRYEFIKWLAESNDSELFKKVVEGWLGIKSIDVEALPSTYARIPEEFFSDEMKQLSRALKRETGKALTEENFKPIRKKIVELVEATGIEKIRDDRRNTLSAKTLNRYLAILKIPYSISKSKKIWTITATASQSPEII